MRHERAKTGLFIAGFLAAVSAFCLPPAKACTMAVVSGKATDDGRPLLWKNRDTKNRRNRVQVFTAGRYRLMAVTDAGNPDAIWMGMNDAGLCIANSLSLDLPGGNTEGRGNGRFMKWALETCASVGDVENLLSETNRAGRRTRANFGVIDAEGGAMLFETGHRSFVKFDANDPKTAPNGYIVRSNFAMSESGAKHRDEPEEFLELYSGERYLRAEALIAGHMSQRGALDYRFFVQNLSRDLANALEDPPGPIDFSDRLPLPSNINTTSTINRKSTVSAAVFHGVKPGHAPQWTTMWTLMGEPAFSVAVPGWIGAGRASACLSESSRSSLCSIASRVREWNYESKNLLSARGLRRVWAETLPVENRIVQQTSERVRLWRRTNTLPPPEDIADFQDRMALSALESLLKVQTLIGDEPAIAERADRSPLVAAKSEESNAPGK